MCSELVGGEACQRARQDCASGLSGITSRYANFDSRDDTFISTKIALKVLPVEVQPYLHTGLGGVTYGFIQGARCSCNDGRSLFRIGRRHEQQMLPELYSGSAG